MITKSRGEVDLAGCPSPRPAHTGVCSGERSCDVGGVAPTEGWVSVGDVARKIMDGLRARAGSGGSPRSQDFIRAMRR